MVCRRCGNLLSVCSNRDIDWHPHLMTCWPTATVDWASRRMRAMDEKMKVGDQALRQTDGVAIGASQVQPAEDPFA